MSRKIMNIGLIIGLTFLVYGRSLGNGFVRWDDSMLIYENPIVREISWKSLTAAFTTYDPELYIPLTFLSYQADYAIWGMNPFGFHMTNLVLHTLNAVLVFWLVMLLIGACHAEPRVTLSSSKCDTHVPWFDGPACRTGRLTMTRLSWVPFFVAILFALHPLNTEAVAWASARKDVLSTFFFLGSLCAYLAWRQRRVTISSPTPLTMTHCQSSTWYWLSVIAFLFGLLSKVMVLTLPVVLLLLESFQVSHLRQGSGGQAGVRCQGDSRCQIPKRFQVSGPKFQKIFNSSIFHSASSSWPRGNFQFVPFFLLSIVFGVVGLFGKQSALGASTFMEKFLMAPKSAVFYLQKIFWPSGLSVLYPYHGQVTIRSADFAVPLAIFILLIMAAAWLWLRWRRASVGLWFFLVTLTPTFLNFAKGGDMDRYFASDRYAYVPSIGIFLFLGVVVLEMSKHVRWTLTSRWIARAAAALCILLLGYRANAQAQLWGNTELLLQNVLRLYGDSSHVAHNNMGNVYRLRGDIPHAIEEYERALGIRPHSKTLTNLGAAYRRLHRYPEAMEAYRVALEFNPKNPEVSIGLGLVFMELGKLSDARDAFEEAIANDPHSEEAYVNLGAVAMRGGDVKEAIEHYRKALESNPYFTQAHYNLAVALVAEGREEEAVVEYEAALRGDPSFLAARINLGILYYNTGRRSEAQAQFRAVLRQDPKNAAAREAMRQMDL